MGGRSGILRAGFTGLNGVEGCGNFSLCKIMRKSLTELVEIQPGRLRIIPGHLWGKYKWLLGGYHGDEFAPKRRRRLPLMRTTGLPHSIHTTWLQEVKLF